MEIERIGLTIDIDIRTKTFKTLKRIYEAQEEISVISKYHSQLNDVGNAIMDDVLADIRDAVKKTIKDTIIKEDE